MKRGLENAYVALFLLLLFVGIYRTLGYLGKDLTLTLSYALIFVCGLVGVAITVIWVAKDREKEKAENRRKGDA